MDIFKELGIIGIPELQQYGILSGMLTGNPILLIGTPGTAKTEIAHQIGAALREYSRQAHPNSPEKHFNYHVYDCSKLNPEDLLGFVDLRKVTNENEAPIIKTPTSIWGKNLVCFDELNRIDIDRQANLFEIIRSRRCLGKPTGTQFILSCMNPFGDQGTISMSDALIDRNMFYVTMAGFSTFSVAEREYVIRRRGSSDSPGLSFWNKKDRSEYLVDEAVNAKLAAAGKVLRDLLNHAANVSLPKVTEEYDKLATRLISILSESVTIKRNNQAAQHLISGRRAAMLRTGMMAVASIAHSMTELHGNGAPIREDLIRWTIMNGLPIYCGNYSAAEIQEVIKIAESEITNFLNGAENAEEMVVEAMINQPDAYSTLTRYLNMQSPGILKQSKNWGDLLSSPQNNMAGLRLLTYLDRVIDTLPPEVRKLCENHFSLPAEGKVDLDFNLVPAEMKMLAPVYVAWVQENLQYPALLVLTQHLMLETAEHVRTNRLKPVQAVPRCLRIIELIEKIKTLIPAPSQKEQLETLAKGA